MVIESVSALPLPGKSAELRALTIEAVAAYNQRWPKPDGTQVLSEIATEPGRVYWETTYESLAAFEAELPAIGADADFMALANRWLALIVPGSFRRSLQRVL